MEVLDENVAMLSNNEVLHLLKDIQSGTKGQKKPKRKQQNLATISYSTLKYLEKTPCVNQTPEVIDTFVKALNAFGLSKAEKLQLLNHSPSTAVEIQLMIEESEERLTESQIEDLLDVVAQNLPQQAASGAAEGAAN